MSTPAKATLGTNVMRALRLRCVACGEAKMFAGIAKMIDRCSSCRYVFAREGGYWLGAMYVNYGIAVALAVAAHLIMTDVYAVPIWIQMLTLVPGSALFVVWFFRYSRALWLALDLTCDPPSETDYRDEGRRQS